MSHHSYTTVSVTREARADLRRFTAELDLEREDQVAVSPVLQALVQLARQNPDEMDKHLTVYTQRSRQKDRRYKGREAA